MCAALGKPFMLTYLHGKASGRLPVLISQAKTPGGGPFGLSPEPAPGQITHHSFIHCVFSVPKALGIEKLKILPTAASKM